MTPADALKILLTDRLADLGPGMPDPAVKPLLDLITPEIVTPGFKNRDAALACVSGLWLLHDFLDESHKISQDLETPEGSFWHAIMHRREPDAWNSKYWWQKVGRHPVLKQLADQSPALGYDFKSPGDFVDFCERVRGTGNAEEEIARKEQLLEWRLLFEHCRQKALGSAS